MFISFFALLVNETLKLHVEWKKNYAHLWHSLIAFYLRILILDNPAFQQDKLLNFTHRGFGLHRGERFTARWVSMARKCDTSEKRVKRYAVKIDSKKPEAPNRKQIFVWRSDKALYITRAWWNANINR